MHYSKHEDAQSTHSKKSGKIHSAIEKAEAIQQREQLRQMILGKFIKDFGKNKKAKEVIEEIVTDYFVKEKVTQESLKALKVRVKDATEGIKGSGTNNSHSEHSEADKKSVKSQQPQPKADQKKAPDTQSKAPQPPKIQEDRKSQRSHSSQKGKKDGDSDASSSVGQKSVYYVEGDEEDEWATLVKFDTELFKKEKELERIREEEFKKKMKVELDRQLQEKQKRKELEQKEEQEYAQLQSQQVKNYDQRE